MPAKNEQQAQMAALGYFIVAAAAFSFTAFAYLPRLEKAFASQWPGNADAIPPMDIMITFWMTSGLLVAAMIAAIPMTWTQLSRCIPGTNKSGAKLRWFYLLIASLWVVHECAKLFKVSRNMHASSGTYLYASYSEFVLVYDLIGISLVSLLLCAVVVLHEEPIETNGKGMRSFLTSLAALLVCFLGNRSLYLYASSCMILLATTPLFPWGAWFKKLAPWTVQEK